MIDFSAVLAHQRDAMYDALDYPTSYRDIDVLLGAPVWPNGITIGSMLTEWQALTALAEYARHDVECGSDQAYGPVTCSCGLDAARAALEEARNPK